MSEYVEIKDDKVINVVVIEDSWTERQAQDFLSKISTNKWIKTKHKAGKGYEHDPVTGRIARKKPFQSWNYDDKTGIWIPPIPRPLAVPIGYVVKWSVELKDWVLEER